MAIKLMQVQSELFILTDYCIYICILDEALVDMVVKDGQPYSVVENEAFIKFVSILDPASTILGRKA